ncbi:MAG: glycosyltransferase family 4 protein [Candidatus Aureabacteria bacterium]|nr:glycosyltransferase family 4 protein [Candidatus Auribacterota bacterium]
MKKILFVISRCEKPSSRLRVLQYLPCLEKEGFSCKVVELRKSFIKRLIFLLSSFSNDIIFIQKKLLSRLELFIIKLFRNKIIYDFDDNVIFREVNENAQKDLKAEKKLISILEKADMVITGNDHLASIAKQYQKKSIKVLPTPSAYEEDTPDLHAQDKDNKDLVWVGSSATLKYLSMLEGVFDKLTKKFPSIRLYIISDKIIPLKGIHTIHVPWEKEAEYDLIKKGNIGLMPLFDNEWCQGKCGFKIIQYMACSIPPVASPVGFNKELIKNGINGFLASNDNEWLDKISLLLTDKELYGRISRAAKDTFIEKYSLKVTANKLISFLKEVD